jgi:hypothetical protein
MLPGRDGRMRIRVCLPAACNTESSAFASLLPFLCNLSTDFDSLDECEPSTSEIAFPFLGTWCTYLLCAWRLCNPSYMKFTDRILSPRPAHNSALISILVYPQPDRIFQTRFTTWKVKVLSVHNYHTMKTWQWPWPWQWVKVSGQLHTPAALPWDDVPRYPLDRRLRGPQNRSGRYGQEKTLPLPWIEPLQSSPQPVPVLTEKSLCL